MVKVTCDRCGRQIGTTLPWMNPEYPILTITSQVRTEEKPQIIDLCQICKVKFYDWLDNGKSDQEFINQESQSSLDGGNK